LTSDSRELIGFFSFSFEDSDLARKLRSRITDELSRQTDENIHFWRPNEVSPIDRDAINQAIAKSDFFIPLISPSFAERAHCQSELAKFFDNDPNGSRIFPIICVSLDGNTPNVLPERLKHHQLYDLSPFVDGSTEIAAIIQRLSEDIIKAARHTRESEDQLLQQTHDALPSPNSEDVVSKPEVLTEAPLVSQDVPIDAAVPSPTESATSVSPPPETLLAAQTVSGADQAAPSASVADILNAQDSRRRWEQAWRKVAREERRLTDQIERLQARVRDFERRVEEEIRRFAEETDRLEAARDIVAEQKKRLEIERPTVELDSPELPLRISERRGAA
jgi:hypothetical protein